MSYCLIEVEDAKDPKAEGTDPGVAPTLEEVEPKHQVNALD